jgi:hypothetical protein
MSIPPIPPEFDVRRLVRAGVDQRGRDVGPFESLKDAKNESRHRFRLLCTDEQNDRALTLALTLFCCEKHARCNSPACPVCARTRRIRSSAATLEFLADYDLQELKFITLINPGDAISAGQLHTFDPVAFRNRLRRQLERSGIDKSRCLLIGAIDGEFDDGWTVFQPHAHFVGLNITSADLKPLIDSWPRDPDRVRVRKRVEEIDDLPRIVTYLDKSWWPSVARANNKFDIHPHNKRRPPPETEREILLWFDRYRTADLRMLYGVKAHYGKLVKS